jgi:hypothetical protein
MRRFTLGISACALGLLSGCGSGLTTYNPQLRAQGELTLRYDNGFSMTAEGQEVASGLSWSGLTDYVECVPQAKKHAKSAERNGGAAIALSWVGAGLGLASLGSLGALAIYDKDKPEPALQILAAGLGGAITGVILAAIGRHEKNVANGHAVDAMNYYNDAVGSRGGTCKKPPPQLPEVEPTPPPPPASAPPAAPPADVPTLEEIRNPPPEKPKKSDPPALPPPNDI